jgi:hypothetical protein
MLRVGRLAKAILKLVLFAAAVVLAGGVVYERNGRLHDLDGIIRIGRP